MIELTRSLEHTLSLPNDLDQDPLPASTLELPIEESLPQTKVDTTIGDRNHHFTPHNVALQVGVAIILACPVVRLLAGGRMRSQFFQPLLQISVETWFTAI